MARVFLRSRRDRAGGPSSDPSVSAGAPAPVPASVPATPPEPAFTAPCHAPFGNLFLDPLGVVTACCVATDYPLGQIHETGLLDIWRGERADALRRAIAADDYSLGCEYCDRRVDAGLSSVQRTYDVIPLETMTPAFPRRLEINISNACNLQCVMCNGDYSSAIRLHREGRPALPRRYDDGFFDDLREVIPHLVEISFTGGEPFLVPEYFRIWEMIAELHPDLPVRLTTNGTQWNRRVEHVLSTLNVNVNVSIDGYTKETYEAVRVGADHATVFANLERFVEHGRRTGTQTRIFHCLMPQNYHDLGDLLLLADRLDVDLEVCLVIEPRECSLELMADWTDLIATFDRFAAEVLPRLSRNRRVLENELKRIAEGGLLPPVLGLPRQAAPPAPPVPDDVADVGPGAGEGDAAAPDGASPAAPPEGADRRMVVGHDSYIVSISPALAELLGVADDALDDRPLEAFDEALTAAFGPRASSTADVRSTDLALIETVYGATTLRAEVRARRGPRGWLEQVELSLADVGPTA